MADKISLDRHYFDPLPESRDFADRLQCRRCGVWDWQPLPQDDLHRNLPLERERS